MATLTPDDDVVATYPEHSHPLARGASARSVMAEMFDTIEGCSRGRGGSMHLVDVGTPVFGEGAVAEGEFHESMDLAAPWGLPVVFACENDRHATGIALERSESKPDPTIKAASYEVPAMVVDGMDVFAVEDAARRAVDAARVDGPQLLELQTYRFRAYSMDDPELQRDKTEVEAQKTRDPAHLCEQRLRATDAIDDERISQLEAQIATEIEDASDSTHLARAMITPSGNATTTARLTDREAMRAAVRAALDRDPRMFVMGAGVGHYGGCLAVTPGLLDELGPERIRTQRRSSTCQEAGSTSHSSSA